MPTPISEMTDAPPDGGWPGATHYKIHGPCHVEFRGPGQWGFYNPIAMKIEARAFQMRVTRELAKGEGFLAERARAWLEKYDTEEER